jgi:hypothetical protein
MCLYFCPVIRHYSYMAYSLKCFVVYLDNPTAMIRAQIRFPVTSYCDLGKSQNTPNRVLKETCNIEDVYYFVLIE